MSLDELSSRALRVLDARIEANEGILVGATGGEDLELVRAFVVRSTGGHYRRTSFAWTFGTGRPSSFSHSIPASQYLLLLCWALLLVLQYCWVRVFCAFGVPRDCQPGDDPIQILSTFQYLLFPGTLLCILTGMHWPDRFFYVFTFTRQQPRGFIFLFVFFLSGPLWGCLDLISAFSSFSLTGGAAVVLVMMVLVIAVVVVVWHVYLAFRSNSRRGFVTYVLSRLAVIFFYLGYVIIKLQYVNHTGINFHFHHYATGFMLASLAEFNHPSSWLVLAIATAVFVQGLAAYGPDDIIGRTVWVADNEGWVYQSPTMSTEAIEFFLKYCKARAWREYPG